MNALFRQRRVAISAVLALVCAGCASHESTVPPTVVTTADHSEATLSTPLERAAEWTTEAFVEMGIRVLEIEMDADARGYLGTLDELSIRAELTRATDKTTTVLVRGVKPSTEAETELARKVLEKIVKKR